MDRIIPELSTKLSASCFSFAVGSMYLPVGDVISTPSSAPRYSPSAQHINGVVADLFMMAGAKAKGSFLRAKSACAGAAFKGSHRYAFCERADAIGVLTKASDADQWYIARWHCPDSAVLRWLAALHVVLGTFQMYVLPRTALASPCLKGRIDAKHVFAREFAWMSYVFQCSTFHELAEKQHPAVRAFLGKELLLVKLAATKAFWSMSKSDITQLCAQAGFAVTEGVSLYELLSSAVPIVMAVHEEKYLEVLSLRLPESELCNCGFSLVCEIEEAKAVLDKSDQEVATQEKQAAHMKRLARSEFRAIYTRAVNLFRLAGESKSKHAKKKSVKSEVPHRFRRQTRRNTSLQDALSGRVVPMVVGRGIAPFFARACEPWKRTSEGEAMRRCIRSLWEQPLMLNALQKSNYPWQNLWIDAPALS